MVIIAILISLISINSPIILNVRLIFFAFVIGLFLTKIYFSWFAFITFLLYVGGILVIFIYFSSLIPNNNFSLKTILISLTLSLFAIIVIFPSEKQIINTSVQINEALLLFRKDFSLLSLYFITLLFVILIAVVKVTSNKKSPIRPVTTKP